MMFRIKLDASNGAPLVVSIAIKPHDICYVKRGFRTRQIVYYQPVLYTTHQIHTCNIYNDFNCVYIYIYSVTVHSFTQKESIN